MPADFRGRKTAKNTGILSYFEAFCRFYGRKGVWQVRTLRFLEVPLTACNYRPCEAFNKKQVQFTSFFIFGNFVEVFSKHISKWCETYSESGRSPKKPQLLYVLVFFFQEKTFLGEFAGFTLWFGRARSIKEGVLKKPLNFNSS